MTRPSIQAAGRIFIGAIWLVAAVVAAATAAELGFKFRGQRADARAANHRVSSHSSRLDRLELAYRPFTIQYLHPQYLFFFPLDSKRRTAISNEVCRIDAGGFRGASPLEAGTRRLAFLLGGSAAFGHYASSDDTTITGYLNRTQSQYLFVNAGVPSWNSTQELFRLVFQIMDYHPALIVAYDGANDAALLEEYRDTYPAGTPESFDRLADFFDDIRATPRTEPNLVEDLFPQLALRVDRYLQRRREATTMHPTLVSEAAVKASVSQHISNLRHMRQLVTADGGRFLSVFQPMTALHRNVSPALKDDTGIARRFHDGFSNAGPLGFEHQDFSSLFDRFYATVPVVDEDLNDETIFVDEVHLSDRGNAIVARELWAIVCGQSPARTISRCQ